MMNGDVHSMTSKCQQIDDLFDHELDGLNDDWDSNLNQQSYQLDKKENIRTSNILRDRSIPTKRLSSAGTLVESLKFGVGLGPDRPCLGWRDPGSSVYEWMTYQEMWDRCAMIGSGICGIARPKPNAEAYVCIFASNCPEWTLIEYGCFMHNLVIVPLYDTLGRDSTKHILKQVEPEVVFCDTSARLESLLHIAAECPELKNIILIESKREQIDISKYTEKIPDTLTLRTLSDIERSGREEPKPMKCKFLEVFCRFGHSFGPFQDPLPEDLVIICYTSGTTGLPKGVKITHKMCCCILRGFEYANKELLKSNFVHISYLPMAHMFEQSVQGFILGLGGQIGFYSGDVRKLMEDIAILRPTTFCTVPRILVRIYDKFMAEVSKSNLKWFFYVIAKRVKMMYISRGFISKNTIWDRMIFAPLQEKLGGRLMAIYCGGASLPPEVMDFTRVAFGARISEGYGSTETTAAITCTLPREYRSGNLGPPLPVAHVKLADVPEMSLVGVRDNKGEICVKGPTCTPGYFKDPESTRKLYDEDGWLHTGDIGCWKEDGSICIVDRCKNIFKLSQGEYVAPDKVEQVYSLSIYVEQSFLDGDATKNAPIALVVPEIEPILHAMPELIDVSPDDQTASKGEKERQRSRIAASPEVYELIMADLKRLAQVHGLNGFERAHIIKLLEEPFSVENGLLTPTLKLCRPAIRERYRAEMNELYKAF